MQRYIVSTIVPALLFFILSLGHARAQVADAVRMRHYGIAQGLPNEQARRIVALPDGRMLAVVEGGVALFDGERFQPLELSRQSSVAVESFLNTDHWLTQDGILWVKATHRLLALDVNGYRQADVPLMLEGCGVHMPLKNFFIDAEGQAWMHDNEDLLYRYNWEGKARRMLQLTQQNNDGNPATVCDIVETGGLHYILLSNDELICFDATQAKTLWTHSFGQPWGGFRLKAMAWDDHTLLIRTREQLIAFDLRQRSAKTVLVDSNIFDFRRFGQDLWVSSRGHLYRLDSSLNVCEDVQTVVDLTTGEVVEGNWQGFSVDWQGGLWTCTFNHGIMYRSPARQLVAFQRAEGRDVYAEVFAPLFPDVQFPSGIAVTDAQRDKDGRVWVATRQQELLCLSGAQVQTYNSENVEGIWGTVAFVDPDSRLFACHLNRLGILHPDELRMDNLSERYPQLLRFRNMVDCCQAEGGLLIGTQNGFFFFDTNKMVPDVEHFGVLNDNPWSDKCNCLLRDAQGIIWIGTQNGLLRYDEKAATLKRYTTADGLPNNCVQSLVEDHRHRIWAATIGGISCLTSDEEFLLLGPDDGVADLSFLERAASVDSAGILRFGTTKGIYSFNPDDVSLPQFSLTPRVMAVNMRGERWTDESLSFRYDQNYLTFDVSALNYAWSQHTVYRYRLRGIDREWTEVRGSRGRIQIHLTGLAPGHYTLEVQAAMQGQAWGGLLELPLRISPPWWQSWWAWTLYVLLTLAIVCYIIHTYIQSQRNKLAIERQEARIRQLLEQIRLRSQLPEETKAEHQEEIKISAQDEAFLQKAMSLVERNLDNSEYGVESFAADMAMERTTLYRRLQTVVGKSPTEFMRTVRLKRASELLRSGRYSVGEVSDMTGFSNRKYFARYFKDAFGVLPSQY